MSERKELAIGEEGVIDGVRVRCVEMDMSECCSACYFKSKPCDHINCTPKRRADEKWVSLQEVKSDEV